MRKYAILLKDVKLTCNALSAGTIVEIVRSSYRGYDIRKDDVVINEVSRGKLRCFNEKEIIPAEHARDLSKANQNINVMKLVDKLTSVIAHKIIKAIENGYTKFKVEYMIDTTDRDHIYYVLSVISQKLSKKGYRVFTTYIADESKNKTKLLIKANW